MLLVTMPPKTYTELALEAIRNGGSLDEWVTKDYASLMPHLSDTLTQGPCNLRRKNIADGWFYGASGWLAWAATKYPELDEAIKIVKRDKAGRAQALDWLALWQDPQLGRIVANQLRDWPNHKARTLYPAGLTMILILAFLSTTWLRQRERAEQT